MKIKARWTGNKTVNFRWFARLGDTHLVRAQDYPGAKLSGLDTWSDDIDPRVTRETVVEFDVPAEGLLVLVVEADSKTADGGRTYCAAVRAATDGAKLDYSAAKWVALEERGPKGEKYLVHIVEIGGKRVELRVQS